MVKMSVAYQGEKHCELTHGPSGSKIETDAPRDNAGKGERFSPTDLVGAALASCVLTTMAIMAEKERAGPGLATGGVKPQSGHSSAPPSLSGLTAEVAKDMTASGPRKIARLPLIVRMPAGLSAEWRKKLEAAAHNCPVRRSLAADVEVPIDFIYPD
jgi:putative redox protein